MTISKVSFAALTVTVTASLALTGAPASAHTGGPGQGAQGNSHAPAGTISTFAGGVGGPGLATTVAVGNLYGITYGGGGSMWPTARCGR
jgi:hypothetical protein